MLLRYPAPANILCGDVPGALLDSSHQGELDVWPLVDGHRHGDQVQDKNGKPLDEESLGRTDQFTIWRDIVKCANVADLTNVQL